MNKIIVLVPFYNEINNLNEFKKLIKNLSRLDIYFKFIFCDDNSNDGTARSLTDYFSKKNIDYEIIKNNTNLGHGRSLIRLSKLEQIKDFDYVLTLDFDFCYMHDDLIAILNSNIGDKIVIGKRKYFDEGVFRQFITTFSEIIIFLKSIVLFKDTNCPIRFYPTFIYLNLWNQIPENTLIPNIFSTLIMLKNKQPFLRMPLNKNKNIKINSVSWGNGVVSKKIKIILFSFKSFKQLMKYKF